MTKDTIKEFDWSEGTTQAISDIRERLGTCPQVPDDFLGLKRRLKSNGGEGEEGKKDREDLIEMWCSLQKWAEDTVNFITQNPFLYRHVATKNCEEAYGSFITQLASLAMYVVTREHFIENFKDYYTVMIQHLEVAENSRDLWVQYFEKEIVNSNARQQKAIAALRQQIQQ